MEFKIPEKFCKKCGNLIPLNGYELDEKGNAKVDGNGKPIFHRNLLLICVYCAVAASPPAKPRPKSLRKGETAEGQIVIDVPSIYIR